MTANKTTRVAAGELTEPGVYIKHTGHWFRTLEAAQNSPSHGHHVLVRNRFGEQFHCYISETPTICVPGQIPLAWQADHLESETRRIEAEIDELTTRVVAYRAIIAEQRP